MVAGARVVVLLEGCIQAGVDTNLQWNGKWEIQAVLRTRSSIRLGPLLLAFPDPQ